MQTKRVLILIAFAALAGLVFILNEIAGAYYLYFFYWWYDIMMHFLGGVLIGGLAAWGALRRDETATLPHVMLVMLAAILAVGIGWEIFEYATGQYVGQKSIIADTTIDLIMDVLGAALAALLVYKMSVRERTTITPDIEV